MDKPPQPDIIRDNHYVPAATLRRWSIDGTSLFGYQLLVPDDRVPEWQRRGIRSLACQRDLYTIFAGGKELDDFERWLNVEFEYRGLEAIDRLVRGSRLTPEDWRSMILFVATQDLRTPLSFIEWMVWCGQEIPTMIERVLRESVRRIEEAQEKGITLERQPVHKELANLFTVTIDRSADPAAGGGVIRGEMTAGRSSWIARMRYLLTGIAKRLCEYRWSVAEPHGDAEWPLTDHPVLRLNYNSPSHYDFQGGWGSPGTEIMMPVSPKHLLYVQVGRKHSNRLTFSPEQTQQVQRLLVERAHRWVFATRSEEWITKARSRHVDLEMCAAEEKAREDFHRDQSMSEASSTRSEDPEED